MFASYKRQLGEAKVGSLPKTLGKHTLSRQHLDVNTDFGHLASDLGKNIHTVFDQQIVA